MDGIPGIKGILFFQLFHTFLFYLVGYVGTWFGVGFSVENFWAALLGSVVVSLVSIALSLFVKEERRKVKIH